MAALLKPMARRTRLRLLRSPLDTGGSGAPHISPEHPSTRRFYVLGGKGGVGKASMAAALAVKFASRGEQTLLVSTDPTSSLGDSLEQDISDSEIECIDGFDSLFASESLHCYDYCNRHPAGAIQSRIECLGDLDNPLSIGQMGKSSRFASLMRDILSRIGIRVPDYPFEELNMDEVLRIPPGLDEAFAIIQLIKDVKMQGRLTHIVLDTASARVIHLNFCQLLTGLHGSSALSISMDRHIHMKHKAVNVIQHLLTEGANAASFLPAIKSSLEVKFDSNKVEEISQQFARMRDLVNDPLVEEIRRDVNRAHELLYDPQSTEFIIVTIPTVKMMAVSESSRFHTSLKKDGAHTRRVIVNQVLPPSASDCRFCAAKRREQAHAFDAILEDRELGCLKLIQAPPP
ncbi:hypothetical protein ACP4OV_024329 [Aristida adscensionis]